MNCRWSEERFERFLDGDLTPRDRSTLLAHVDACDGCRGLLEELRVVDALLLEPRTVTLAPNFTFATMAEVRALPTPAPKSVPVAAYAVCYLVATWSLIAAAFLIAPQWIRSAAETAVDAAQAILASLGGLGHVAARLSVRGDVSWWTTFVGGVLLVDVMLAVILAGAVRVARPLLAERLRS